MARRPISTRRVFRARRISSSSSRFLSRPLDYDREVKTQIYAQAAVHEYWLVDLSSRSVSRYSDPRDGAYLRQAQFRPGETIAPAALPQCAIPVEALLG